MGARRQVTVLTLLYMLLAFCAACVAMCLISRMRNHIVQTALNDVLKSLAIVFSTPVSVVVAGVLQEDRRRAPIRYPWAASLLVGMWGLIVLIPFVLLVATNDMQAEDVRDFCDLAAKDWAFLISGVLAFNVATAKEKRK